jgi:putative glutathione S-transferase
MDEVSDGAFKRTAATFRQWVKSDGSTPFAPASGRYHLIVAFACPWANRTTAVRSLKGLESAIGITVVDPVFQRTRPDDDEDSHVGWLFREDDQFQGARSVRDLYGMSDASATKFTVPILYDNETKQIVNNESSEIIRMLNSEFGACASRDHDLGIDLYPEPRRTQIDAVNEWIYESVNNGVYRCGFAHTQAAYDEAVDVLFDGLDRCEAILASQRYIASEDQITEADIRLFMTLVRFDEVYTQHFKCNKARVADYPNLENFVRELYQVPGIAATVNMAEIKRHYFCSHESINRFAIIAAGPGVDYTQAHDRDVKFPRAAL